MTNDNFEKFYYIYSYCFITRGEDHFSIYDSSRGKLFIFDSELYEIAAYQLREYKVKQILSHYNSDDCQVIIDFIDYLSSNNLGRFVSDISFFPPLEEKWDAPYIIKRCIIDVRHILHNFDNIFCQLSELLCPKIEIRFFKEVGINTLQEIITIFEKYDFGALFLLLPCYERIEDQLSLFSDIVKQDFRIFFNINSIPEFQIETLSDKVKNDIYLSNNVRLSNKEVKGKDDCGIIRPENLHSLSIQEVIENKIYNGCLNRLISIDENGYIRNCPSMLTNYGNVTNVPLKDVIEQKEFRRYWTISNSEIDGCSSCELRIICLGCRAYSKGNSTLFCAPSKCSRLNNYEKKH